MGIMLPVLVCLLAVPALAPALTGRPLTPKLESHLSCSESLQEPTAAVHGPCRCRVSTIGPFAEVCGRWSTDSGRGYEFSWCLRNVHHVGRRVGRGGAPPHRILPVLRLLRHLQN